MGDEDSIELGFPPGSLAIDADSNILYILEENKQYVHRYSLSDEELLGRFQLTEGKPSGITFAWSYLWVMDSLEKRIGKYSVEGVKKGSIDVSPKIVGYPRGLASSADHLWGASNAGWSSKIFRINPESGRLDNDFFCECDPIDLASDDNRLWTICYNGPVEKSVIDERVIGDPVSMYNNRTYPLTLEITYPTGLAYMNSKLYISDKENEIIVLRSVS